MGQTAKVDRIVINIEYSSKYDEEGIRQVLCIEENSRKVLINFTKDLGPHTKLIPTLDLAGDDDYIISVDDDVLYDSYLVEKLCFQADLNPSCIICSRGRIIRKNIFGRVRNYNHWYYANSRVMSQSVLALGFGGVCYKKSLIDLNFIRDTAFRELAPTTDDLWFKMSSVIKGTSILFDPDIYGSSSVILHSQGLDNVNIFKRKGISLFFLSKIFYLVWDAIRDYLGVMGSQNDRQWKNIQRYVRQKR